MGVACFTIGWEGQETGGGGTKCSGWDVGFEHSLKARRCSSPCCSVGKHQGLGDDVSFDRKLVDCAEERGDMGELRKVEHRTGSSILDNLIAQVGSPAYRELQ